MFHPIEVESARGKGEGLSPSLLLKVQYLFFFTACLSPSLLRGTCCEIRKCFFGHRRVGSSVSQVLRFSLIVVYFLVRNRKIHLKLCPGFVI